MNERSKIFDYGVIRQTDWVKVYNIGILILAFQVNLEIVFKDEIAAKHFMNLLNLLYLYTKSLSYVIGSRCGEEHNNLKLDQISSKMYPKLRMAKIWDRLEKPHTAQIWKM